MKEQQKGGCALAVMGLGMITSVIAIVEGPPFALLFVLVMVGVAAISFGLFLTVDGGN